MKNTFGQLFSSDNREVVVARLSLTQPTVYELQLENTIQILTNDNLKSLDFVLENNAGTNFSLGASDFYKYHVETGLCRPKRTSHGTIADRSSTIIILYREGCFVEGVEGGGVWIFKGRVY